MQNSTLVKFENQVLSVPIDPIFFRHVMRKFATGVTVLTIRDGESLHGMTANAFASVSLSPTLILVCIEKGKTTHAFVSRSGNFAMNILSATQEQVAKRFAKQVVVSTDPFAGIAHHSAATGAPIFDDCIAYVDCHVISAHDAGDHTIFVGHVEAAGYGSAREQAPLVWFNGDYTEIASQ